MMSMDNVSAVPIRFAFKEWAVVCDALADGRQSLILRKGGIAEEGGQFRPDHARFWLFPTYLHQKPESLKPKAASMLPQVESQRRTDGKIALTHFVEVPTVYRVARLDTALELDSYHIWLDATVEMRFHYRGPGLFVLPARVYLAEQPLVIQDLPEYEGCKTWVDLHDERSVSGTPVLNDRSFADILESIDKTIHPIVVT
jgi:hypothetical protein